MFSRPVSPERLAAIPWAGAKPLAYLMARVAIAGPFEEGVWHKLFSRARIVEKTFTDREAAVSLNALKKVPRGVRNEARDWIQGLIGSDRSAGKLVVILRTAKELNVAVIANALVEWTRSGLELPVPLREVMMTRISEISGNLCPHQTALLAAALGSWGWSNCALEEKIVEISSSFNPRGMVMVLNYLGGGSSDEGRKADILLQLTPRLLEISSQLDPQGCALALNCLARLGDSGNSMCVKECSNILFERFCEESVISKTSLLQLAWAVNALIRLPVVSHLEISYQIANRIDQIFKSKTPCCDLQSALLISHAFGKLGKGCRRTWEEISRLLVKSHRLSPGQAALAADGFGRHENKFPGFQPLAEKLSSSIEQGVSVLKPVELFMAIRGLGRMGVLSDSDQSMYLRIAVSGHLKNLVVRGDMEISTAKFLYRRYLKDSSEPDLHDLLGEVTMTAHSGATSLSI